MLDTVTTWFSSFVSKLLGFSLFYCCNVFFLWQKHERNMSIRPSNRPLEESNFQGKIVSHCGAPSVIQKQNTKLFSLLETKRIVKVKFKGLIRLICFPDIKGMFHYSDVTPCSLVNNYKRFGATYCLHLQGAKVESTKHLFLQDKWSISINFCNIHSSAFIWKADFAFWRCIISHSILGDHASLQKLNMPHCGTTQHILSTMPHFATIKHHRLTSSQLCLTSPLLSITWPSKLTPVSLPKISFLPERDKNYVQYEINFSMSWNALHNMQLPIVNLTIKNWNNFDPIMSHY